MFPISEEEVINKLYIACRTCYSKKSPNDMLGEVNNINTDKKLELLKHILDSGHHSVLEHVQVTFLISGVSRALSHQLVRHRLCSYSQKSQRYCGLSDGAFDYVTPNTIKNNSMCNKEFEELMKHISQVYKTFIDEGIKAEDARAVLPNACCTDITMSLNLREFIHICNERMCSCAQLEIRTLVRGMANKFSAKVPFFKEYLAPKCSTLGYCNESTSRSCGLRPRRVDNGN